MAVLLVLQIIIVVSMIVVILLQKSSSDGFTGASSSNGLMSGRASANLLTRITSILAALFIINSLVLAYLSSHSEKAQSIVGGNDAALEIPLQEGEQPVGGKPLDIDLPEVLPADMPADAATKTAPVDDTKAADTAPEVPAEQ